MRPEEFAKTVIEHLVHGKKLEVMPKTLAGVEVEKAGSFVSLKTAEGDLRGCIGTILATKSNVIEEIMHNAIAAATRDPRFNPVEKHELGGLKYSVDVLHPPETIQSLDMLDPKTYGIIIVGEKGGQALLLPDLEGLDTIEKQVAACLRKGNINPKEKLFVQRFKVDRYNQI